MRGPGFVLAVLVALPLLAPGAAADTAVLETRDAAGNVRSAFEDGETIVFRVTVRVSANGPVAHRIYLYSGLGTSGSNVGVIDHGGMSTANRLMDHTFEVVWDQRLGGVRVPAGQYTAQFRAPDGTTTTARLDLDWGPDMVLSFLRAETTSVAGSVSPLMSIVGCVKNDGVQPVAAARITLASFDTLTGTWTASPVTSSVPLGDGRNNCPWPPATGTAFSIAFLAPPRTSQVRGTADVAGTVEQDPSDDARTVAVRWAV